MHQYEIVLHTWNECSMRVKSFFFYFILILAYNECASNPCLHGACQHQGDGYLCSCSEGWRGTTCNERKKHLSMNRKNFYSVISISYSMITDSGGISSPSICIVDSSWLFYSLTMHRWRVCRLINLPEYQNWLNVLYCKLCVFCFQFYFPLHP